MYLLVGRELFVRVRVRVRVESALIYVLGLGKGMVLGQVLGSVNM